MEVWKNKTLQSLFVPGSLLLLASIVLLRLGFVTLAGPAIEFYYYAVFSTGALIAWRFHSSRNLFALISIFLAHRAVEFFSAGKISLSGPSHIALGAITLLLPINFLITTFVQERGLTLPVIASRATVLFFESVFIAVICRPGQIAGPDFLHWHLLGTSVFAWTKLPQVGVIAFAVVFAVLLIQFAQRQHPLGSGLIWSLAAVFLGLQAGCLGKAATVYIATAGLILIASIIENSYVLAYHDELTHLPSRRAYNEALLRLEEPYAVAVVDIDHFKNFNDTYGHDTGDQVLRLVATKLNQVTGGGQAFRVGGEEFSILFPGKRMKDVVEPLEALREVVATSMFKVRENAERRQSSPRAPDRRASARKPTLTRKLAAKPRDGLLSVTVSIGAAEPSSNLQEVKLVIEAADKALYKAKKAGRNRVETSGSRPRAAAARGITA